MSCYGNSNSSYFTNLDSAARQNHKERSTVVQGDYMKVNVMCVAMCQEVGTEVHEAEDQLITVVCGNATVKLGNTRCTADCVKRLSAGDSVFIPAGTWHNVCNTGNGPLKLISVYAYGNESSTRDCTQTTTTTCTANTNTGCSNVFNAENYNWNSTQTQSEGCSCAIDSGC